MDISTLSMKYIVNLQKWVNMFSTYILWLMMVYLTDVWELDFVQAAAIINIWMGLIKVLPILFAHLADAIFGNHIVILFSSLSSMIGLGLIWMSTPPVLGKSIENCTQYKPQCISELQKHLLYTGLVLTAVGMAAHKACYASFVREQVGDVNDICECLCVCCCVGCRVNLIHLSALLVATFVKPWATLFGICAVLGATSFLFSLICRVMSCHKHVPRPLGSPLTTVCRVLVVASSKSFCPWPSEASELYESPHPQQELLPHTKSLRWFDKAAIIKDEPPLEQQEKNRWKLCKVTEVEETKLIIRTIPIWMTFIICGMISSLSSTYFIEQAKRLDPRVGKAKAPLILFLWFYDLFKRSFTDSYRGTFSLFGGVLPRVGFALAMIYATLSCITAAKIEERRLGVVQGHGLVDNPDERVPMSIFLLLPQFALLGGLDGVHWLSVYTFSFDQSPVSTFNYFNLFARGFFGLGVMGSVVLVYVVGEVSEATTGSNWFQSTLNTSRLDNYYWVLAALSTVNLAVYVIVACFYRYRDSRLEYLVGRSFCPMDDEY